MKTITKTFDVFSYTELNETAQLKAVNDQITFYIEFFDYENAPECIKECIDEMEKMQTPWFIGECIYENCMDYILDDIDANEYLYLANGEMYNDNEE